MPSVEKRNEFAQNFNQLSAEQITHIVECLSQECPSAIEEVEGVVSGEELTPDGRVDVVVDRIGVRSFHSLFQYEQECLKG